VPNHLDAEQVLKEIEIQQGILVERARYAYSFSHLTFQEYLTAKCIVDNQKIDQLVRDHATDKHWREVFLLVAGLSPGKQGADRLLLAMEQRAQTYRDSDKLLALLAWSESATHNSPGDILPAAKRVAAVFLDLDLERALDLDLDLDFYRARARALYLGLDLAENYKNLGLFNENMLNQWITTLESLQTAVQNQGNSRETRKEIANRILSSFFDYFCLDIETIQLSNQEVEQLHNYFYILQLMVHCKESAVRVSPQVWQGIESRMLTVPKGDGG
jgi:hypothetical protein